MKPLATFPPPPAELKTFCFAWQEEGKPQGKVFRTPTMPSNDAFSIVHRINQWRSKLSTQEQADTTCRRELGISLPELLRLKVVVEAATINQPLRTIAIYSPKVMTFTLEEPKDAK